MLLHQRSACAPTAENPHSRGKDLIGVVVDVLEVAGGYSLNHPAGRNRNRGWFDQRIGNRLPLIRYSLNSCRSSLSYRSCYNRERDLRLIKRNQTRSGWLCLDSPRVSDAFVKEMQLRYGEDSPAYHVRVLGNFPPREEDTVIPVELIDSAMNREIKISPATKSVWGLDVARMGSDASALAKRRGPVVEEIQTWKGLDLMQLTGAVVAEFEALTPSEQPVEILVDSIGLGAGVLDRLRELGLPARGINVAESPAMKGTYANLRAELWFKCKGWLANRDVKIPKDEQLQRRRLRHQVRCHHRAQPGARCASKIACSVCCCC